MPGRTARVDTQRTPPVDVVNSGHGVNKAGRLGSRNVTGTPGQSWVGRRDSQGSGPAPESLHSRTASKTDLPEPIESELEDSLDNDEVSRILSSLEASRKPSRTETAPPPELHGSGSAPEFDSGDELLPPALTSHPTPPAEQPSVSVSSSDDPDDPDDPDVQKRKEEFKNELQPKLGFLDKYKKEISVTAAGGLLVGIGAAAAIFFPPAGLCLYACGIMMLSMGLSKMMFALDDTPENPAKPKPDEPKPKPDEPKPKEAGSSADDGKFMAVRKPVLEALTQGDGPIPVREDGSLDEDEAKKRLKKFAEESQLNVDPEKLLKQVSTEIQTGLPLSEAVAEAIAGVLSKDKNFDPHDAEFKAVTNAILSAAEAMMNATSASEREQALAEFLTNLKEMLPRMRDASLDQFITMTKGALASAGTEEARAVFNQVLGVLEAEKAGRMLTPQQATATFNASAAVANLVPDPPAPPPAPPPPPGVPKPKNPLAQTPPPIISGAGSSEAVDLSISRNLVHYRVLSFELSALEGADQLNGRDKNDFLKAAKEVLEKPGGTKITGAQFLDELKDYTGDRFTHVIDKMRDKAHFK